jgi:hypothetical protein
MCERSREIVLLAGAVHRLTIVGGDKNMGQPNITFTYKDLKSAGGPPCDDSVIVIAGDSDEPLVPSM